MDILNQVIAYAPTALAILGALVGVLVVVAPLTASKRDDEALVLLQQLMNFIGKLIGAGPKPPALPPVAPPAAK